jgi:hypothetical protein
VDADRLLSAAGLAGVLSERAATTVLPAVSALYCLDGLIGVYTHVQGVRKRPGGFREPLYNIVMGPRSSPPGHSHWWARWAWPRPRPQRAMSEELQEGASEDVGHLPHHGGASDPGPPPELPRQQRGITPQANPALTIMALASRLAERLAGKRIAA